MRLLYLQGGQLRLTEYLYKDVPPYAILSHRWGNTQDEVSYLDVVRGVQDQKPGWAKLRFCAEQARRDGLRHFWVDTCCIDKGDARELSRAIASMFKWYADAQHCYVYLVDVTAVPFSRRPVQDEHSRPWEPAFRRSQWFTRGWTLQELLAPSKVSFFSYEGRCLGDRGELSELIQTITGIDRQALLGKPLSEYSEADRFRWAVNRQTTEPEDHAYCLLGIFGVSMPPYYGECEDEAYDRLKEVISRKRYHALIKLDPKEGRRGTTDSAGRPTFDAIEVEDNQPSIGRGSSIARPPSIARSASILSASFITAKSRQSFAVSLGITDLPSTAMSRVRRASIIRLIRFDAMNARRLTIKLPFTDTCGWLLDHVAYKAWSKPRRLEESFLWIKGHPGAGKSTLMKFLDYHLADNANGRAKTVISFYFNARGERIESTVAGAYRSLIAQLLEVVPDLDCILDRLRFGHNTLPDSTFFEHAPIAVLQELFASAVSQLGDRQIYCLLDALDETDEDDVLDLVDFLQSLRQGSRIMICFASRHYPTLEISSSLQIVLDHEVGHTNDIRHYINAHLHVGPAINDQIKTDLQARANGIFLWVILAVAILNKEHRRGTMMSEQKCIQRQLSALPQQLSSLFLEICRRGDVPLIDFVLCLQWLLFAARPLRLEEFYFALQPGLSTTDVPNLDLTWHKEHLTHKDMENCLITYSKGLAEVTKVAPFHVQLIHESAREFLLSSNGLADMFADFATYYTAWAHERLKLSCHAGICIGWQRHWNGKYQHHPTTVAERHRRADVERLPFTSYAVEFVFHHAEEASMDICQSAFLSAFPFSLWNRMAYFIPTYEGLWASSILGATVELGHLALVQTLLDIHTASEKTIGRPGFEITLDLVELAMVRGDSDMIKLLLFNGAHPDYVRKLIVTLVPTDIQDLIRARTGTGLAMTDPLRLTRLQLGERVHSVVSPSARTRRTAHIGMISMRVNSAFPPAPYYLGSSWNGRHTEGRSTAWA